MSDQIVAGFRFVRTLAFRMAVGEEAPVAVEYAILLGLVAVAVSGTVSAIGLQLIPFFEVVLLGLTH